MTSMSLADGATFPTLPGRLNEIRQRSVQGGVLVGIDQVTIEFWIAATAGAFAPYDNEIDVTFNLKRPFWPMKARNIHASVAL